MARTSNLTRGFESEKIEHGRQDIHVAHHGLHAPSCGKPPGKREDERHSKQGIVELMDVIDVSVIPQAFPVV